MKVTGIYSLVRLTGTHRYRTSYHITSQVSIQNDYTDVLFSGNHHRKYIGSPVVFHTSRGAIWFKILCSFDFIRHGNFKLSTK